MFREAKGAVSPVPQPRAGIPAPAARAVVSVVHLFPYSPALSGGHSNAIRSFIACQQAQGIHAVAVAPKPLEGAVAANWEFPLLEVDSLWHLRYAAIAEQFALAPGSTLLNFHSVNHRLAPLQSDLRRRGIPTCSPRMAS